MAYVKKKKTNKQRICITYILGCDYELISMLLLTITITEKKIVKENAKLMIISLTFNVGKHNESHSVNPRDHF